MVDPMAPAHLPALSCVLFLSAEEGRSPKISISWCYGLFFFSLTGKLIHAWIPDRGPLKKLGGPQIHAAL
jgi:hypothetical protein